jgi:radical SAM protein with 4Fe4S-binding SPASM domain
MSISEWQERYLRLHPRVALKDLETPYLYHIDNDELYELNAEGRDFLMRCDGTALGTDLTGDGDFVKFCLEEGLLEALPSPSQVTNHPGSAPNPSLRYLELQLTRRCNLSCRHCYLGPPLPEEMPLEEALFISRQFEEMGGLRLIISGGEPLLYPHLRQFIEKTGDLKLRRILLSNGTLIDRDNAPWLKVDEIQFSLDGWQHGHDMIRGEGSFARVMSGIAAARNADIPVSLATIVHRGNLDEFERIKKFSEEIDAVQWGVDILCMAGALADNPELIVPYEVAVPLMEYAYGGGYHGSSDGFSCGRHLMTVTPAGKAVKCGFYGEKSLGDAGEGLLTCWLRLEHIPVVDLECNGCPMADECAGGCRFRADHPLAPDRAMCAYYGINPEKMNNP